MLFLCLFLQKAPWWDLLVFQGALSITHRHLKAAGRFERTRKDPFPGRYRFCLFLKRCFEFGLFICGFLLLFFWAISTAKLSF